MQDKKIGILVIIISLVGLGVYSLCAFLLVSNYTSTFWMSYIFTTIAFFSQIIVGLIFGRSDVNSKFLQLTLLYFGGIYFVIQLVAGILFMIIPMSVTLPLILQVCIFAIYLSIILASTSAKEQITKTEANINIATFNIKMLTIDAEHLYMSEVNENKKTELKKMYEAIRDSDPMSTTDAIKNLDLQIDAAFKSLSTIVDSCTAEELNREIKPILDLLTKRNLLCKSSK